jgi:cytochrome c
MIKPMTGRAWAKWSCGVLLTLLAAVVLPAQAAPDAAAALSIVQKNNCLSCHAVDSQVVGPAYREITKKYHGDATAPDKLFTKVRNGGAFVWGEVPMPANPTISDADLHTVIAWILAGAPDH